MPAHGWKADQGSGPAICADRLALWRLMAEGTGQQRKTPTRALAPSARRAIHRALPCYLAVCHVRWPRIDARPQLRVRGVETRQRNGH